jgi:Uma2 family endonuclease
MWHPTAALVVEIVSPGDETRAKLPFYAARRVDEVLILDAGTRAVEWLALSDGGYASVQRSGLIELGPAELDRRVEWP